jgi:hypothetical protein
VVLELRRNSFSPERHFRAGKVRLLQQSLESGEALVEFGFRRGLLQRSSRTTLELFAPQKTGFFLSWSAVMRLLSGKSCSRTNPGLKRTRTDAIFKKFYMKRILKSIINLTWKTLNFLSKQ